MRKRTKQNRKLQRPAWQLSFAIGALALFFVAIPRAVTPSQTQATPEQSAPAPLAFDAASIKLNQKQDRPPSMNEGMSGPRFRGIDVTLPLLIYAAYELPQNRIFGLPDWADAQHFDVEAVADGNPTEAQKRLMIQSLLADRFKPTLHHETRQLSVYALVVAKPGKLGPQLHPAAQCPAAAGSAAQPDAAASSPADCRMVNGSGTADAVTFTLRDMTVGQFVPFLAGFGSNRDLDKFGLNQYADRPIIDRTGLSGPFDFTLTFARLPGSAPIADPSSAPSVLTALQEQLGLKLEVTKGPVDVLVIDHVEEPSPN